MAEEVPCATQARLFVEAPDLSGSPNSKIQLPQGDRHYLTNVLRLSDGAQILAICRHSRRAFSCELSGNGQYLHQLVPLDLREPASIVKTLIFALCRGKKNDLVVEKATELGVEQVIIWQASRSVKRFGDDRDRQKRVQRWMKIAEGAARQCGRVSIPRVDTASQLSAVIELISEDHLSEASRVFCSLDSDAPFLRKLAPSAHGIHLLIGPEGDFSDREVAEITGNGFTPASLGPRVLRAETAAIAAVAIAQGLWENG